MSALLLSVSAGYGAATEQIRQVQLEPYGAVFGFEPSYRFHRGARLGAFAQYALGRSVSQTYEPLVGAPFDYTAQASSLCAGVLVGHDLRLYMLLVRYTLALGFTRMSWDFGDFERGAIVGFSPKDTKYGFLLAPGLALVWPIQRFEFGIGFDYLVPTADQIPLGVQGKLTVGVRSWP